MAPITMMRNALEVSGFGLFWFRPLETPPLGRHSERSEESSIG